MEIANFYGAAGGGSAVRPNIDGLRATEGTKVVNETLPVAKAKFGYIFSKPYFRTFLKSVKFIPVVFLKNLLKCAESEKPR
jgi:hypothetical protein